MWDLIVSVSDHCLSFYFEIAPSASNIAIPLFFILLLSFPASSEPIINSKRLRMSFGSL